MKLKETLICCGRHPDTTENVWVKIRTGKDTTDDKWRKAHGWEIAYYKKGSKP